MILVILGICVALAIAGWITLDKHNGCSGLGEFLTVVGFFGGILALVIGLFLLGDISGQFVIDEKIAMYREENAKIEEQIAIVVEQYQQYESDIFKEVAPESAITLVSVYPELKSDTLVQAQIDVYVENNEKIKTLLEAKIDGRVARWWLYFGE